LLLLLLLLQQQHFYNAELGTWKRKHSDTNKDHTHTYQLLMSYWKTLFKMLRD
jgi:hypothetical protein